MNIIKVSLGQKKIDNDIRIQLLFHLLSLIISYCTEEGELSVLELF